MKKVLVFGTFDELHDGHRFLLDFARSLGDELIASVAHDDVVLRMKKRLPAHTAHARIAHLQAENLVDRAHMGDSELGGWTVLHHEQPDIVVVGYDQDALHEALSELKEHMNMSFDIVRAPSYQGDTLHTSLLRETDSGVQ
jgi:cytidyltransferase-like protein